MASSTSRCKKCSTGTVAGSNVIGQLLENVIRAIVLEIILEFGHGGSGEIHNLKKTVVSKKKSKRKCKGRKPSTGLKRK